MRLRPGPSSAPRTVGDVHSAFDKPRCSCAKREYCHEGADSESADGADAPSVAQDAHARQIVPTHGRHAHPDWRRPAHRGPDSLRLCHQVEVALGGQAVVVVVLEDEFVDLVAGQRLNQGSLSLSQNLDRSK